MSPPLIDDDELPLVGLVDHYLFLRESLENTPASDRGLRDGLRRCMAAEESEILDRCEGKALVRRGVALVPLATDFLRGGCLKVVRLRDLDREAPTALGLLGDPPPDPTILAFTDEEIRSMMPGPGRD